MQELSSLIRKYRKEKGYTQTEVAEKLNVTEKAVSTWECGRYMPDILNLVKLCKILEIPASEIINALENMID